MKTFVASLLSGVAAWDTQGYPWFDQWKVEEYYMMPNGKKQPLPLRLHSHELVLTGTADYSEVAKSLTGEYYSPVSVGGKASVQVWMNNFTDTDCGNDDTKNPYLETWISTWVCPNEDHTCKFNYTSDMSLLVADPKALIWIHRVILGDAPGIDTSVNDPALGAQLGGHGVWGFPKHPVKALINTNYEGEDRVQFHARHLKKDIIGKESFVDAITADVFLPEKSKNNVAVPVNVKTAPDAVIGGPLWMVQQTRFGEAFNTTQNIAPWDPSTDKFSIGSDDYYSSVLRAWNFEPKLKMHTNDFQIAAFKPVNWQGKLSSPMMV